MRGLKATAEGLGLEPVAEADMDKIMWKNAARLWKIKTNALAAKPRHRGELPAPPALDSRTANAVASRRAFGTG